MELNRNDHDVKRYNRVRIDRRTRVDRRQRVERREAWKQAASVPYAPQGESHRGPTPAKVREVQELVRWGAIEI